MRIISESNMADNNLLRSIGGADLDPADLEAVLSAYYGRAVYQEGEVHFHKKENGPVSLRLQYNEANWTVLSLQPGEAFACSDVAALSDKISALSRQTDSLVGRSYLFNQSPVTGWFRCDDWFQILPVPETAPRPLQRWAPHPFTLEVSYIPSAESRVDAARQVKRRREVELIVSTLGRYPLQHIGPSARMVWVHSSAPTGVDLRQEGYVVEKDPYRTDDFSDVTGLDPIKLASPNLLYGVGSAGDFTLPIDIHDLLLKYRKMSAADQRSFLRSAYWLQYATETSSISASFGALVRAIEVLMPTAISKGKCATCNQDQYERGAASRYRGFMEHYVPGGLAGKEYYLRSALEHGGKLLQMDESVFGFLASSLKEHEQLRNLKNCTQIALRNWLSEKNGGSSLEYISAPPSEGAMRTVQIGGE